MKLPYEEKVHRQFGACVCECAFVSVHNNKTSNRHYFINFDDVYIAFLIDIYLFLLFCEFIFGHFKCEIGMKYLFRGIPMPKFIISSNAISWKSTKNQIFGIS